MDDITTPKAEHDDRNYLERELEARIRSDANMWRFLRQGSLDGVWYWDLENPENEWMSPEFWRLFGIDPTTRRHDPSEWQGIIFPEDLALAIQNFEAHVADPDHPYDQIVRYRHVDGSTVTVRCRGLAIRDETGKAIRMLGAHNDLTPVMRAREQLQRKQSEIARKDRLLLGKHESDLRARLIELSHDAIVTRQADGTILSWNLGAERLYGFRRTEAVGQKMQELLHADPTLCETVEAVLDNTGDWSGTMLYRSRSGATVEVASHQQVMRVNAQVVVMQTDRDLSDLRIARSELEHINEQLMRANTALEDFAYVASHDFSEPVRGIALNAQFLQREELAPGVRKRVERISELCGRLDGLMDDLLFFSRIGRSAGAVEDVDLEELVLAIGADLTERPGEVVLETALPPVRGEQALMDTLFRNLIVNALRYNDAEVPRAWVGFVEEQEIDGRLCQDVFYVRDNGIGIAAQDASRAFQIFTRLGAASAYGAGSGSGLAFVEKAVTSCGGRITLTSTPGAGTTFWFSLPAVMQATQP